MRNPPILGLPRRLLVKMEELDMQQGDDTYLRLLQTCQADDLKQRLDALEDLCKHGYLHLVPISFLIDRLNSTTIVSEQAAILRLMGKCEELLPEEILETMIDVLEAFPPSLLREVVGSLAVAQAEEMLNLLCCFLEDCEEVDSEDPNGWKECIPAEVLFALLDHPQSEICAGALDVLSQLPSSSIPIDIVLPYCSHEQGIIRKTALSTLMVAEERVPPEPILVALRDPESDIRAVASHACISLVKWFGERIPLEPLVQALTDTSPQVREDLLDALGQAPLRAPVEPVVASLTDSCVYVRCAAVETLGFIGQRVPLSIYPIVQAIAESDPDSRVRQRATSALLSFT